MSVIPNLVLEQSSLADQVYDNLKLLILSGTLKGGERIPEEQVAQQFGVSRTPIREALKRLAEYGLVSLRPRLNATVTSITKQEAADIGRVRLALEVLAVESIMQDKIGSLVDTLQRLAAECQYCFAVNERAKAFEKDSEFHIALVSCAGNKILTETYERLDARIQLLRITQHLTSEELLPYAAQHIELIRSLREENKDKTRKLLELHIMHDIPS
ncbi:MAG: GntR family transcriptional regulator [Treponemataceae bacterium]